MGRKTWMALAGLALLATATALVFVTVRAESDSDDIPRRWTQEFPKADFTKRAVPVSEILSGGPPRDGIPAIDDPVFQPARQVARPDNHASAVHVGPREPVIRVAINGDLRAYPLSVLMWHEIVNDEIGGTPIAVTFCPLCNASVAFERPRVDGISLDFGTTGRLRHSDLIMYDRQTETWWQQFTGEAIMGHLTGQRLKMVPVRVVAFEDFVAEAPDGPVLVPTNPRMRNYGANPYRGYDSVDFPFLYRGDYDGPIPVMARVVAVDDQAWALCHLAAEGRIEHGDLRLSWRAGMRSALDASLISEGRDVGSVRVERRDADGTYRDAVHDVTFAFAFDAFVPDGTWHGTETPCD